MDKTINVTPTTTFGDIKKAFHEAFPQLKMEFFNTTHPKGGLTHQSHLLHNDNDTLNQYFKTHTKETTVTWHLKDTVWEVEQKLEQLFNIHAQVFRKMGSTWIATSKTDQWTLEQQTKHSIEAETPIDDKPEIIDYTERD